MLVNQEMRRLSSRYLNGVLMYDGLQLFTWVKMPNMPWALVSIAPHQAMGS